MSSGFTVRVLGDTGPFSRQGLSISYLLELGGDRVLIDCGAPLFQLLPPDELKRIDRLVITHCHDDHKRWFTDLALFHHYAPDVDVPLTLIASDEVLDELRQSTRAALGLSLSPDSRRLVGLSLDDYVRVAPFGPSARFRIDRVAEGGGRSRLQAVDEQGEPADPRRAKVVVDPRLGTARLLVRDPDDGCWVDPSLYYAFGDPRFHGAAPRRVELPGGGTLEPINAPVWHGLPTVGVRVTYGGTTLVFSSDTRHDTELWESLWREARTPAADLNSPAFLDAPVVEGPIDDYIERMWSERRYREALAAFDDALVIHDVAGSDSVVHTDGSRIDRTTLDPARTLLTHAPDRFTTDWRVTKAGRCYRFDGRTMHELVDGDEHPLEADFYHKQEGRQFVLFRNPEGRHEVRLQDGLLQCELDGGGASRGSLVCRVDAYEDFDGRYLPLLAPGEGRYRHTGDGRIERLREGPDGSRGTPVEDLRPGLTRRG